MGCQRRFCKQKTHIKLLDRSFPQAKKAAEAAAAPKKTSVGLHDDSQDETDPNLYYENRVRTVKAKKAGGAGAGKAAVVTKLMLLRTPHRVRNLRAHLSVTV